MRDGTKLTCAAMREHTGLRTLPTYQLGEGRKRRAIVVWRRRRGRIVGPKGVWWPMYGDDAHGRCTGYVYRKE